ncbi:MAG TPA: hypothetical protein QGF58_25530 [Myxococcota bacterium]|nr:hypothetical protein [Myxococcota bacterium]
MHQYLIPFGGVVAGAGFMTMLFGWEGPGGVHIAEQISMVGFSAVGDISLNSLGQLAFALILIGIGMMVWGNRTAWKETSGY